MIIAQIHPYETLKNNRYHKFQLKTNPSHIQRNNEISETPTGNNLVYITFGALSIRQTLQSESKLYTKFLENNEKGILSFLRKEDTTPGSIFKFLVHLTGNKVTREKTAEELSKNPRKGESIKKFLVNKLGGNKVAEEMFYTWFHDEKCGYRKAYSDYYKNQIWSNAKGMDEIITQSPNVHPKAFVNKAQEISVEPILGEIPKEFGSLETFRILVNHLKDVNLKISEQLEEILAKKTDMPTGLLSADKIINEERRKLSNPLEVNIDNKIFEVTPIIKSHSSKYIYSINKKGSNNKFILKCAPYNLSKNRFINEDVAAIVKPDMPYLLAMTDFYLKFNKCKNVPEIEFFDYGSQAVLYKMTEGKPVEIPEKYKDNIYLFSKFNKVSDIYKLGVKLNDIHNGNFIENNNNDYIIIDSGHAYYSNEFRPLVISRHISLGNQCGREICK